MNICEQPAENKQQEPIPGPGRLEPVGAVEYRLTDKDEIYLVNRQWRQFANYNDAPELAENVVGQSIWSYIDGSEIQQIYDALFKRVRKYHEPVRFHFRCDAPDRRRVLEMALTRLHSGGITIRTHLVKAERRCHLQLIDPSASRDPDRIVTMCSWCQKFRCESSGHWVEADEAPERLKLFEVPVMPRISHGICHSCLEMFQV